MAWKRATRFIPSRRSGRCGDAALLCRSDACAQVAELVDALVSGTSGEGRGGPSPFLAPNIFYLADLVLFLTYGPHQNRGAGVFRSRYGLAPALRPRFARASFDRRIACGSLSAASASTI